jgi:hypothetical protein
MECEFQRLPRKPQGPTDKVIFQHVHHRPQVSISPAADFPTLSHEILGQFLTFAIWTYPTTSTWFHGCPEAHTHTQLSEKTSRLTKTSHFSSYHNGTLIVKVMPNPEHEVAAGNFDRYVMQRWMQWAWAKSSMLCD